MNIKLPGTTVDVDELNTSVAKGLLDGIFAAGGLVLSQIATITGVELYSVQNWVKRGFVSPPVAKKYSKRQFCRLVVINMLKDSMSIKDITDMLSYINGDLSDESDDTVSDDMLYLYFISMLGSVKNDEPRAVEEAAKAATENYAEPAENTRERLCRVLCIMYFAYRSAQLRKNASELIAECQNKR